MRKLWWVYWYLPLIPVLVRLREEDHKFKASLDYRVSLRPVSKEDSLETNSKEGREGEWEKEGMKERKKEN
jgi:hypothetical protein